MTRTTSRVLIGGLAHGCARAARAAVGVLSIAFLTEAGPGLHALTPPTRQAAPPAATAATTPAAIPAAILAAQDMTVLARTRRSSASCFAGKSICIDSH
jgi:hypothetical protein